MLLVGCVPHPDVAQNTNPQPSISEDSLATLTALDAQIQALKEGTTHPTSSERTETPLEQYRHEEATKTAIEAATKRAKPPTPNTSTSEGRATREAQILNDAGISFSTTKIPSDLTCSELKPDVIDTALTNAFGASYKVLILTNIIETARTTQKLTCEGIARLDDASTGPLGFEVFIENGEFWTKIYPIDDRIESTTELLSGCDSPRTSLNDSSITLESSVNCTSREKVYDYPNDYWKDTGVILEWDIKKITQAWEANSTYYIIGTVHNTSSSSQDVDIDWKVYDQEGFLDNDVYANFMESDMFPGDKAKIEIELWGISNGISKVRLVEFKTW